MENYQLDNIETQIRQENERHKKSASDTENKKLKEKERHDNLIANLKNQKDSILKRNQTIKENFHLSTLAKLNKEIEMLLDDDTI